MISGAAASKGAAGGVKIGLFGGTFNPVHLGHLRAAEEIREKLGLGKIIFIPAHMPPHKKDVIIAAGHRCEMVRAAVAGNPFFEVSDIELQRRGRSYSFDTIEHFCRMYGSAAELFFIIGLDAFREIHTWKHYPDFFAVCNFVVMSRPGQYEPEPEKNAPPDFRSLCVFNPGGPWYEHLSGHRIYFCRISLLDISSTGVRQALHAGKSVKYLVPDAVAGYIAHHKLYRNPALKAPLCKRG
jgi:nicotinate-nucleotide adenylyltransferase